MTSQNESPIDASHPRTPPRWLRASQTAAPAVALVGTLIVAAEAVRRLRAIAEREDRLISDEARLIYEHARHDAWLLLVVALGGAVFGALLVLVRSGRWGWSIGLGLVGVVLVTHWGMIVNSVPFFGASALAWVGDDQRLHPAPEASGADPRSNDTDRSRELAEGQEA